MFGCPENELHGWKTGYINMTLNTNSRNMFWNDKDPFTFEPHILGPYTQKSVQLNICLMKNNSSLFESSSEKMWPDGNYCIYKVGDSCPEGKVYLYVFET